MTTPWYEAELHSQLERLRSLERSGCSNQHSEPEEDEEEPQRVFVECESISSKKHMTSMTPDGRLILCYRPDYYIKTMRNIERLNRKIDKIIRQVERTHFSK